MTRSCVPKSSRLRTSIRTTSADDHREIRELVSRALAKEADDAELFVYPGDRHLFTDSSLPTYDADAAALVTERVLGFLARL